MVCTINFYSTAQIVAINSQHLTRGWATGSIIFASNTASYCYALQNSDKRVIGFDGIDTHDIENMAITFDEFLRLIVA